MSNSDQSQLVVLSGIHASRLGNDREVYVYLPAGYDDDLSQRYPVLYMHVGQHVFNPRKESGESWGMHRVADRLIAEGLIQPIIIVAVEHKYEDGTSEYFHDLCAYPIRCVGEDYEHFLIEELKPLLDRSFRTLPQAESTGLMGSSAAGIATYNIGLRNPDVFGMLGILSPFFVKVDPYTLEETLQYRLYPQNKGQKIWLDIGGAEGFFMPGHVKRVAEDMLNKGWKQEEELYYFEDREAAHSEWDWGRRAHMPLIHFFGDKGTAVKVELQGPDANISEALDFFNRDHEPRQTSKIFITEGKASQFLMKKPLIENTISQQLKRIQESTAKYSAKSMDVNLFMLNLQLESQTGFAAVPYISPDNSQDQSIALKGLALLKNGKMIGDLSPIQTEHLNILLNKYRNSIIKIPCEQQADGNHPLDESLEVVSLQTKIKQKASMGSIQVHISIQIKSSAGELLCSDLSTIKGEKKFIEKARLSLERDLRSLTDKLQARKIDILGIGNQIYRVDPGLWRSLKPDWDIHFQHARFTYDIRISLIDTGMLTGKSSVSK